jgi:hypothetical protein
MRYREKKEKMAFNDGIMFQYNAFPKKSDGPWMYLFPIHALGPEKSNEKFLLPPLASRSPERTTCPNKSAKKTPGHNHFLQAHSPAGKDQRATGA